MRILVHHFRILGKKPYTFQCIFRCGKVFKRQAGLVIRGSDNLHRHLLVIGDGFPCRVVNHRGEGGERERIAVQVRVDQVADRCGRIIDIGVVQLFVFQEDPVRTLGKRLH